ncbi:MAG: hypothetical protein WDA16_10980 [Candidatus Thermoplasmatota archaeon]
MGRASRAWAVLLIGVMVLAGIVMFAWTRSAAFLILPLGPLFLVPFAFLRREWKAAESAPSHRRVPPPIGVPAEDVSDIPTPITACPDCGYLGVRFLGIRDGVWPGGGETGARFVCPRCGFQGIPLQFDEAADYVEFLRELQPASSTVG